MARNKNVNVNNDRGDEWVYLSDHSPRGGLSPSTLAAIQPAPIIAQQGYSLSSILIMCAAIVLGFRFYRMVKKHE